MTNGAKDDTTRREFDKRGRPLIFSLGEVGLESTGQPRLRRGKTTMTPRTQRNDRDVPNEKQPYYTTTTTLLALVLVASTRRSSVGGNGSIVSGGVAR